MFVKCRLEICPCIFRSLTRKVPISACSKKLLKKIRNVLLLSIYLFIKDFLWNLYYKTVRKNNNN